LRRRIKVFRNTAKFSLNLISQPAQRDFREIIFLDPRLRGDDKIKAGIKSSQESKSNLLA